MLYIGENRLVYWTASAVLPSNQSLLERSIQIQLLNFTAGSSFVSYMALFPIYRV
jgi:hypothetical protein